MNDRTLLQRLLTGELDPAQEPARSALAASSELRSELAALRAASERVASASREEREILAEIETMAPSPEEDRLLELARATFTGPPAAARPGATGRPLAAVPILPIGLAAAALLAVGLWLGSLDTGALAPGRETPRTPRMLGSRIELLAPLDRVADYDEFRWNHELGRGQLYEVTLWDDETGAEVGTSPRLSEPRWRPPASLELPRRLAWQVVVLDAASNPVARGMGYASRTR